MILSKKTSTNLQKEWHETIKKDLSDIIYTALLMLCGEGYNNGIESSKSMSIESWKELLKKMAYSSVSLPNQIICMPNNNTSVDIGGKSHDIETRIALNFYHRFKCKKRKQLQSQSQSQSQKPTLKVISDLGLIRCIESPKQLAAELCFIMEDLYNGCDIRSDVSGLICIVTKWRMKQLREFGKLPCPSCIKWFKGKFFLIMKKVFVFYMCESKNDCIKK